MNTNKQTGDTTMNESYKDKFNATMKQFGIDSLDDLKSDDEKKKFFKAVDKSHDAVNESVTDELMAIAEEMKEGGPGSGPQGNPQFGKRKFGSNKKTGPIAKALGKIFKKKAPAKLDYKRMDTTSGDDFESDEFGDIGEMMKEMMKEMAEMAEMKMLKAETDPTKVEMMKKEMMKEMMKEMAEMSKMPEMMKKEMMKEMSKKMNEYGSMNIVAMKEYTGGSPGMSVSSNTVKTALKNLSKGQALHVSGKPQRGLRTMGRVISISGDTVKIKPTASNGPTSANVKDITSMNVMKEELTPAQKKLPAGLQKAIAAKQDKKETVSPAQQAAIAISKKEKKEELEEKHVPGHQETAVNAMAMNAMKKETARKEMMVKAMKMPIRAMKTGDDDMTPDALKLNAMIKDPHKSREENPKKDLNATYMKSDVRADVKNGGGTDMSKVQDAPKMMTAMKKISAMYKTEKYHDTKPGSLNDALAQMHLNEHKTVSIKVQEFSALVETYLAKGGVLNNLTAGIQEVELNKTLKLREAREFITTYNRHFMTNYKTEEFIKEDELEG